MGLLFQSGTAIFVPHSHPCQYLSFIDMTLFRQVSYCFSLFYPANDDEPLFITVLHKNTPKVLCLTFGVHFILKQPLFLLYTLRLDGFDVPPKKGNKLIKKQGLLSLFT